MNFDLSTGKPLPPVPS